MDTRYLGNSGLEVSVVGLGTNNFGMRIDQEAATAVVRRSLELGINLFDTADIYGGAKSEEYLGRALGADRHNAIIATKFGMSMGEGPFTSGGSRRYIMTAVEDSLRRLRTDYIDLYQIHQPDHDTPLEETMRALDDLVRDGKVRYLGNSNYDGWEIASGHYIAQRDHVTPFISAQNHYSLLERSVEAEIGPACEQFGLGMLPFFPLASGMLTGKYRRNQDGARRAHASPGGPWGARIPDRPQLGHRRAPRRVGGRARPHAARPRVRVARLETLRRQRDRRRDEARASRGQRRRGRLAAHVRGDGGGRRDRALAEAHA